MTLLGGQGTKEDLRNKRLLNQNKWCKLKFINLQIGNQMFIIFSFLLIQFNNFFLNKFNILQNYLHFKHHNIIIQIQQL